MSVDRTGEENERTWAKIRADYPWLVGKKENAWRFPLALA